MSGAPGGPPAWIHRLYSLMLRLYPRPVYAEARAEMVSMFADLYADARRRSGRIAAATLTVRAVAEVVPLAYHARRGAALTRARPAPFTYAPPRARTSEGSWTTMPDRVLQEIRYALRTFRLNPGYFAVTVLTLAIGIGANTAIFSVVKGVLLDTLPYADPDRVVALWQYSRTTGDRARLTPGNFVDMRASRNIFASAAAFGFTSTTLISGETAELINGGRVSADYFDVLGIVPVVGRSFTAADEDVGGPAITILGEELWARRFDADPRIVGQTVNFDGTQFQVVGILPRGIYPTFATVNGDTPFTPDNHDYLVPLRFNDGFYADRRSHVLGGIAKLGDGVNIDVANETMGALATSIGEDSPLVARESFGVELLADEIVGAARTGLLVLMGTVAVVLLIAATNVASLMLARSDARHPETAVRAALGAGRWALVRQSLIESLALTGIGAAAGIGLAYYSLGFIKALVPFQIPRMNEVSIDGPALLFAVVMAFVVGTVLGIAPTVLATRSGVVGQLRQGARGMTASGKRRRAHGFMVAAQTCMAVVLVIGAGLLVRTFVEIKQIDPGFTTTSVVTLPLNPPATRYPDNGAFLDFYDQLEAELLSSPQVAAVAYGYDHPLRKNWDDAFGIEGHPAPAPGEAMGASFRPVTPGYFEAIGIPLQHGRTFEPTDVGDQPFVVVINEALARQYFGSEEPVGQRIRIPTVERIVGAEPGVWMEIVGVVGNVRFNGPTEAIEPAMYVSIPQVPLSTGILMVSPARVGLDILPTIRAAIGGLDPELPIDEVRSLDVLLAEATARQRFNMLLVGLFAVLALGLAGLGIYGLISRLVSMRVKEIGVRVALGAQRRQVLGLVLSGALTPVMIGGALGIVGAAGLSRLLETLLYEVGALDPATFLLTPLVLLSTALLASYLPARRATAIEPVAALRQE